MNAQTNDRLKRELDMVSYLTQAVLLLACHIRKRRLARMKGHRQDGRIQRTRPKSLSRRCVELFFAVVVTNSFRGDSRHAQRIRSMSTSSDESPVNVVVSPRRRRPRRAAAIAALPLISRHIEFDEAAQAAQLAVPEPVAEEEWEVLPENHLESEPESDEDEGFHSEGPTDDEQWTVERIVDHRNVYGNLQVYVKWFGFDSSHNSWVSLVDIDAEDLMQRYFAVPRI